MVKLSQIQKARQEATALRKQEPSRWLNVEDLNPRSRAVKDLEMSVRRCLALEQLCTQHLDRCEGDTTTARITSPDTFGSVDKVPGSNIANPKTLIRDIFGDNYWAHPQWGDWSELFDTWYSGSLTQQRRALLLNLPKATREKYK